MRGRANHGLLRRRRVGFSNQRNEAIAKSVTMTSTAIETPTISAGEVNWGASPGDGHVDEPYLYVSPWAGLEQDGGYWNIDFGAVATRSSISSIDDALDFFRQGRRHLGL